MDEESRLEIVSDDVKDKSKPKSAGISGRTLSRTLGDYNARCAADVESEESTSKKKKEKLSAKEQLRRNRRTVVGIALLIAAGVVAFIISVVSLIVTPQYIEPSAFVMAASFIALVPGVYYANYVRQGLKGTKGYNLERVPMWRQPT